MRGHTRDDGQERVGLLEAMSPESSPIAAAETGINLAASSEQHLPPHAYVSDAASPSLPMSPRGVEAERSPFAVAEHETHNDAPHSTPGRQVLSLLKPVCITMALVVYLAHALGEATVRGGFSDLMVYQEQAADSVSTKAGGVLMNSLALVAMLFVVTTGLLLLYKLNCYRIIYGWMFFSVASLLFTFGAFVGESLLFRANWPLDAVSFYLLAYNYAAAGTVVVFWSEFGLGSPPIVLRQGYLVLISALLAWSATKLPEWTTWGVLGGVALWDVVAVLTPRGPLKLLVEEAERRGDPIPGLVYEGADIKLGLGDFVFYSILVGRASLASFSTLVACTLAVLTGLIATLSLLPVLERVLPALPISIAIGAAAYFLTAYLVDPLVDTLATTSIFL